MGGYQLFVILFTMSIPFAGALKRSGGVSEAISRQLKSVTLKPVKRVSFKFDPFHERVVETRYFMHYITAPKVLKTNLTCSFKTEIQCDRTDPSITFKLVNGEEIVFKSANLTALEMCKLFNKHISVLAPEETVVAAPITAKASKKVTPVKKK
uniref:Large ribosomal subunit protein mL53 n=1 Tax=Riptortus pedestris TaxID=329032 RepID=R4WQ23_RIPPE|nr:mitochondrial ribosomal protein L53 [Riptortus pedestris]